MGEADFVDGLEEPGPKRRMHLVGGVDDFAPHPFEPGRIPFVSFVSFVSFVVHLGSGRRGQLIFSTWLYSSSTGVARPKMETVTRRRARSSSTCSTLPLKLANGPSVTRTASPISKLMVGLGRSTPSSMAPMIRATSLSDTGIGLEPEPRKPVTLGVFLIRW